jgi:hypothetical protein
LAERVQGLEEKQRQSFDAATGAYPDNFSPDEQTGSGFNLNRAPSFSSQLQLSNPFPRSEYSRNRIPSLGWSFPDALRSRALGSLAIAPNESSTALFRDADNLRAQLKQPSQSSPDPLSSQTQRLSESEADMPSCEIDEAFLGNYYQHYHPHLGLLPAAARAVEIINLASAYNRHAFATAVELLPDLRARAVANGDHENNAAADNEVTSTRKELKSVLFENFKDLESAIARYENDTALSMLSNNNADFIVMTWTAVMLAILAEYNMARFLDGTPMSRLRLLHFAAALLDRAAPHDTTSPYHAYLAEAQLAFSSINVQSCFAALALGEEAPATESPFSTRTHRHQSLASQARELPSEAAYLASTTGLLHMLNGVFYMDQMKDRLPAVVASLTREAFLQGYTYYFESLEDASTTGKKLSCMVEMLLAANSYGTDAANDDLLRALGDITTWAETLAGLVMEDATPNAYNPVDLYAWSVVVFVLCHILRDCTHAPVVEMVRGLLDRLAAELRNKSGDFHKNYDFAWYFDPKMVHWADGLVAVIERFKVHALEPKSELEPAIAQVDVPFFAPLFKQGYLKSTVRASRQLVQGS